MTPGATFLRASRRHLAGEYVPKIGRCLRVLEEDDVWWRPNEASNSVGALLRHLSGNTRQWIVSGVGGAEDVRRRSQEFEPGEREDPDRLFGRLRATVSEACGVLEDLEPVELERRVTVQGQDVTALEAVYHVVEHFSTHTGQIVYVAKLRTGRDLAFYRIEDGLVVEENW